MNVYVHVPFCFSKCRYCAFYSDIGRDGQMLADYPRGIARELELRGQHGARPLTLYIGGGTPSVLGADGLRTLFANLPLPESGAEISVEVNPGDVTPALASAMRESGVTRVSIGAQSFDPATLAFLGRRHTVEETLVAVSTLRHAGFDNLSLDLIAAVPGMPPEAFHESLARTVELRPTHVSVYSLSIEPGTFFHREVEAGRLTPLTDDESLDAIAVAESTLCHAGYGRYELSNYALPGFECLHNLAVWRGEDYVGIGPSAASREGLERRTNTPDIAAWQSGLAAIEVLSPEDDEQERFVTGLRLAEGQCPDPATPVGKRRLEVFRRLEKLGMLCQLRTGAFTLTARGREVADAVMAEL